MAPSPSPFPYRSASVIILEHQTQKHAAPTPDILVVPNAVLVQNPPACLTATIVYIGTNPNPQQAGRSAHAGVLEPVGPAVFLVEEGLAVGEAAGHAALALGRIGAVEEGDVLVANVAEPARVLLVCGTLSLFVPKETHQWMRLLSSSSPRAMLWTGASPQRS